MLYPAVARWNSKCFGKIERRRIQFTTTNIIATAIYETLPFELKSFYQQNVACKARW
jgi:hypothetical protein